MIKIIIICLVVNWPFQSADPQTLSGRFVAWDTHVLDGPHEPRQQFIVEIPDERSPGKVKLMKVVYFAPTNSLRGGAKLLEVDLLGYAKLWKLKLHQPSSEREAYHCSQFSNFILDKGKVFADEENENVLRFRSTQFEADMKFERLPEMPCMILDSLSQ